MTLFFTEVPYYSRIHHKKNSSLAAIEATIFMNHERCIWSKPEEKSVKKSAKERSNGHDRFLLGYLLVSKDSPKKFLGIYLSHKSHNVKLKLYLELS